MYCHDRGESHEFDDGGASEGIIRVNAARHCAHCPAISLDYDDDDDDDDDEEKAQFLTPSSSKAGTRQMSTPITTSEWARTHGTPYRWNAALTNHEPVSRDFASGTLYRYDAIDDTRGPGIILEDASGLKDAHNATYLIDDGRTVEVFYVSGWGPRDAPGTIFLSPFPVNVNADGTPRLRANDGRPVDYSTWQLGPRRAYHLKISAVAS